MLPIYFGLLCDLVTDLGTLEAAMPPSAHQYRLHARLPRFDGVLDTGSSPVQALIAELALLSQAHNDTPQMGHEEDIT